MLIHHEALSASIGSRLAARAVGLEHHGLVEDDDGLWNTRSRSMAAMQDFAHVALQCFELGTAPCLNMECMKIRNIQYPSHGSLQWNDDEIIQVIPKRIPTTRL